MRHSTFGFTLRAVSVRVRPLDPRRGERTPEGLTFDAPSGTITQGNNRFKFAAIYEDSANEDIFEAVGRPLVNSAMAGYNGTLFTYGQVARSPAAATHTPQPRHALLRRARWVGVRVARSLARSRSLLACASVALAGARQTGSGKTYTMGEISKMGSPNEGVGHRMVSALFGSIARDLHHAYEVKVSFLQVHIEKVYDLLAERRYEYGKYIDDPLPLREDRELGVHAEGAQRAVVRSAAEAYEVLRQGASKLAFASTQMNKHSSRSHAVCQLHVRRRRRTGVAHSAGGASSGGRGGGGGGGGGVDPPPFLGSGASRSLSQLGAILSSKPRLAEWRRRSVEMINETVCEAIAAATDSSLVTSGKLSLVDLAGSEDVGRSGATGLTLAEAKKINTSLLGACRARDRRNRIVLPLIATAAADRHHRR